MNHTVAQEIKQIPIDQLNPAEYNPRVWLEDDIRQLTESIKRFGLIDPIIANCAPDRMNIVIGGHFRLKIARDLGYKTVPVIYLDIPDLSREMELNLRLNRNTGRWDWDLLANIGDDVLKEAGFDEKDLENIIHPEIINDVALPEGEKPGFSQMTFVLSTAQADQVKQALDISKALGDFVDTGNENSNGNAIARLAELFNGMFNQNPEVLRKAINERSQANTDQSN